MTIETAFRSALIANATVKGIVGERVYPMIAPSNADMPFIVYGIAGDVPMTHISGVTTTHECRIQVDCVAATYKETKTLSAAVQTAMNGWTRASSPEVASCYMDSLVDEIDWPADGTDEGQHRTTQDYILHYV